MSTRVLQLVTSQCLPLLSRDSLVPSLSQDLSVTADSLEAAIAL